MNEATATPKLLLRPKEAAEALAISERTLFTLTKEGKIPHVPVGERSIRYDLEDLKEYLQSQKRTGLA